MLFRHLEALGSVESRREALETVNLLMFNGSELTALDRLGEMGFDDFDPVEGCLDIFKVDGPRVGLLFAYLREWIEFFKSLKRGEL